MKGPINGCRSMNLTIGAILCALFFNFVSVEAQTGGAAPGSQQVASSIAVVLVGDGEGVVTKFAPAIAIRSDGVFLVPYHVIKDAKELQVRLKSGEIFDDVLLLGKDVRRDVAAIRIQTSGLSVAQPQPVEEIKGGDGAVLFTHSLKKLWTSAETSIRDIRMADEIPGAGEGFRVIQFKGTMDGLSEGGVLVSASGNPVGIVTSANAAKDGGLAVPISNVLALGNSERSNSFGSGVKLKVPSEAAFVASNNPSLEPRDLLLNSKTVYVDSDSIMFKEHQLVNELNKRKEIKQWGWVIVTGSWDVRNKADMIIELDHQAFTFDFTFTLRHRKSSVLITAGKVIIADGASGASKMVDKIIKNAARIVDPTLAKEK